MSLSQRRASSRHTVPRRLIVLAFVAVIGLGLTLGQGLANTARAATASVSVSWHVYTDGVSVDVDNNTGKPVKVGIGYVDNQNRFRIVPGTSSVTLKPGQGTSFSGYLPKGVAKSIFGVTSNGSLVGKTRAFAVGSTKAPKRLRVATQTGRALLLAGGKKVTIKYRVNGGAKHSVTLSTGRYKTLALKSGTVVTWTAKIGDTKYKGSVRVP